MVTKQVHTILQNFRDLIQISLLSTPVIKSGAWKINHRYGNDGQRGVREYRTKVTAHLPWRSHGVRPPGHIRMHPRGPRGHHTVRRHHSWKFAHGFPSSASIQIELNKRTRKKNLTSLLFSVSLVEDFPTLFPCKVNNASFLCRPHIHLDCVAWIRLTHLAKLLCVPCDRYGVLCRHNRFALVEICPCYDFSHYPRRCPPFQPKFQPRGT